MAVGVVDAEHMENAVDKVDRMDMVAGVEPETATKVSTPNVQLAAIL